MKTTVVILACLPLALVATQAADEPEIDAYAEPPGLAEVMAQLRARKEPYPDYPAHDSTRKLVGKARQAVGMPGYPSQPVRDEFSLKREFVWKPPHGQWMQQLLKDIDAAKAAGDIETYNALTARYSAWAEKYLRRDDPPNLDGIR